MFHICTVASERTKELQQLLDSCAVHGVKIDILGLGQPWRGYSEKFLHVQNYLESLTDSDVCLFVDAYRSAIYGVK